MVTQCNVPELLYMISHMPVVSGNLLEKLNKDIDKNLRLLDSDTRSLPKETRNQIIDLGYLLDINSSGEQRLFYLGRIIEQRKIQINSNYLYLFCSSQLKDCYGCPYPKELQESNTEVYTHQDITWFDTRIPAKNVRPIPLDKFTSRRLEELRQVGEINYQRLRESLGK